MKIACILLLLAAGNLLGAEPTPLHKLTATGLQAQLNNDSQMVQINRAGLQSVLSFMDSRPDLFTNQPSGLIRREEKEAIWNAWQRFLDYMIALDCTERYHARFDRLKGDNKEDSFLIGYSAMLARYRGALEFIERAEKNPEMDKILNDAVPELGLPSGTFAKLKFRHLNVAIAIEFAARETVKKTFSGERNQALRKVIQEDADYIWRSGKGKGEALTAKNALKIVQNGANLTWFPVQAGVAEWMGDVKVHRPHESLISEQQIHQFQSRFSPGDVFLERREWYLSNIGLPGFWSHAAIYIGTPAERRAFFDDPETRAWVKQQGEPSGDFEVLLKSLYPAAYEQAAATTPAGGPPVRIIEAIGEGVSLTTLEHSAGCDSLAVLRPRLPKSEKARALVRAFHYAGRPYDYNFDFATDAELVCTELVYKSYEPASGFKGINFPITEVLGRKVTPANELAKQFDTQAETPDQQFDLALFLDGQERQGKAIEASLGEFRQTWKRPKWHVLVQPAVTDP